MKEKAYMFEGKNSIRKDLIDFIKDNELIGGTYSLNDVLTMLL